MEGVVTHTAEDISAATSAAFVNPETAMRPAIKGTLPEKNSNNTIAPPPVDAVAEAIPPAASLAAPLVPDPVTPRADFSDEDFERELARRTKGAVKSLADLQPSKQKTKEELAQEDEEEKGRALEWKLSTGTLSRSDYERAISEKNKGSRELALEVFSNDIKEITPNISSEEIEEHFKDYYMEDADESDPKRKLRLKEMNNIASAERENRSGVLDKIDPEYQSNQLKERNKKSISTQIDNVFDLLPADLNVKSTYKKSDGTDSEFEIPYTIDEADFKDIKKEVRKNMVDVLAQLNVDPKEIKDADINKEINSVIKGRLFDKMMSHVASQAAIKGKMDTEAHYKNIPVRKPGIGIEQASNSQRKVREFSADERLAMHGRH